MEPETDPVMDVSVRISAGHHAPRRGQPVYSTFPNYKTLKLLEKPRNAWRNDKNARGMGQAIAARLQGSRPAPMMTTPPLMTSASRTIGLAAFVAAAPGSAWAGVSLSGSYQAGELGRVELSTQGERLVGRASEAGVCGLAPRSPVLEGEFQGNVLVGKLTLCLQGPSCPATDTVALVAFYSPVDHTLTAFVQPRAGCQSLMLGKSGLFLLQPASEAPAAAAPVAPARSGGSSVASLRTEKRNPEAAKEALEKGNRLLGTKDLSGSVAEFERSIFLDDHNWVAFFGLGTAHLMGGQAQDAIAALMRARALNPREPSIPYHLACAYSQLGDKRRALESLRQAVKLGFAIPESSRQDTELDRLLGSDVEYVALTNQAVENYRSPAGRRPQTGP